ncbi:response regulator transcription factor [Streptomyces sp. P1-3]|uniref:response regulator transcription factor n=1 Tax=Streptomyces sp. P1-3 TaxID=3421658 RepID=UPI003D35BF68
MTVAVTRTDERVLVQVRNGVPPVLPAAVTGLTGREREALVMLREGRSNPEVGRRLGIGVGAVKSHVGSIPEKTGCGSRVLAAVLAHQAGLMG